MLLVIEEVLSVFAITLPAVGAAIGGYSSLLELSRISARSRAIARCLQEVKKQHLHADTFPIRDYLESIEEVMLIDSEDWLALMEHAELERLA